MPEDPSVGGEERGPSDSGTLAVLQAMLTTFADVMGEVDDRMTGMESILEALQSGHEASSGLLRRTVDQLGRVEGIEAHLVELATDVRSLQGDEPQRADLRRALYQLSRIEPMEANLGELGAVLQSLQTDAEESAELHQALYQLRRVEAIEADVAELRATLAELPIVAVADAVARLERQVDDLHAQPGPGPALSLVAGELAQRFEHRTQMLVDLVEEHGRLMDAFAGQVQSAMSALVSAVEDRQAELDALVDNVWAAAGAMEDTGGRIDDASGRAEAVLQSGADLPAVVGSLREVVEAIGTTAKEIKGGSVAGLTRIVRDESELLGEQVRAVSVTVESLRQLLGAHVEDTTHSLGRKASMAGRRLAADLGLGAKPRPRLASGPPAAPPQAGLPAPEPAASHPVEASPPAAAAPPSPPPPPPPPAAKGGPRTPKAATRAKRAPKPSATSPAKTVVAPPPEPVPEAPATAPPTGARRGRRKASPKR